MTSLERPEAVFASQKPDRTPIPGGWIACPEHIVAITGADEDEYWKGPEGVSIRAYRSLGTDGLVGVFVPASRGGYRCVDHTSYTHGTTDMSLEEAVARVDSMPSPEKIEADFDFGKSYAEYVRSLQGTQKTCGDMVWMPAN